MSWEWSLTPRVKRGIFRAKIYTLALALALAIGFFIGWLGRA